MPPRMECQATGNTFEAREAEKQISKLIDKLQTVWHFEDAWQRCISPAIHPTAWLGLGTIGSRPRNGAAIDTGTEVSEQYVELCLVAFWIRHW